MNTFTAVVNLCGDPEDVTFGEKSLVRLRLADNTPGKQAKARFFNAIVSGPDIDVAHRLAKGDQIVVTGQLSLTEYKAKKGKLAGKLVTSEEMPFAKILQVTKSPSFFEGSSGVADEGDQDPAGDDAAADQEQVDGDIEF